MIGSAFLITGFATSVASQSFIYGKLPFTLAYIINLAGFYLAFLFTNTNYLTTRIICHLNIYIRGLESNSIESDGKAFTRAEEIIASKVFTEEFHNNLVYVVFGVFADLWRFCFRPSNYSGQGLCYHTYIIPLGFQIFWIAVFFTVFRVLGLYILIFFAPLMVLLLVLGGKRLIDIHKRS